MSDRRIAILIGNQSFPEEEKLPDLLCPLNDIEGLSEQLLHPERGGFDVVKQIKDSESSNAFRELNRFVKQAGPKDTLLFYYSGHGKLDDRFALYLCTRDSEVDLLESSAISMDSVWDLLGKCKARQRIVLLDCCFSGSAAGVRARGNLEDALKVNASGTGSYLLTASDAIETAQEKEGDKYGVFTKHLIAGLESGDADPDGNGFVTMDDMYRYICRSVRQDSPQKPTRQVGGSGNIVLANSGKDPRKDRAEEVHQVLSAKVKARDLDGEILDRCVHVAKMRPSQMSAAEKEVDAAVSDLLEGKSTFSRFIGRYHQALTITGPEKVAPPETVDDDPPTVSFAAKLLSGSIPGGLLNTDERKTVEPTADTSDNTPALTGITGWWRRSQDRSWIGKSSANINYGTPILLLVIAMMISAANSSEEATMTLIVGGMLMAITIIHMRANKDRLTVGGMIANGLVCGMGAIVVLGGLANMALGY